MMINSSITAVLCLMAALQLAAAGSNQPGRACPCPRNYRPVCGADGRAYSNKCLAQCAGVRITDPNPHNPKTCNKLAILPTGPATRPTGSSGSSSRSNSGPGRRLLTSLSQQQQAGPGGACPCPRIYEPVCGTDGTAYNNKCEAVCKGASITQQRPLNGKCNTVSASAGPAVTTNSAVNDPSGPAAVSLRPWLQQGGPTGGSTGGPTGSTPVGGVCACPLILIPVCDSNGKTHANECVARCNGVSVVAKGSCN